MKKYSMHYCIYHFFTKKYSMHYGIYHFFWKKL